MEDGLACRMAEVRAPGGQAYLALEIRNHTDRDRFLVNELPMGRPSGSYSAYVEARIGETWTPAIVSGLRWRLRSAVVGTEITDRLRIPARGAARLRLVEFWKPTGGQRPLIPRGELGSAVHVRAQLRWFDWTQGYRRGNHRAVCPPLVTRWVRWQ